MVGTFAALNEIFGNESSNGSYSEDHSACFQLPAFKPGTLLMKNRFQIVRSLHDTDNKATYIARDQFRNDNEVVVKLHESIPEQQCSPHFARDFFFQLQGTHQHIFPLYDCHEMDYHGLCIQMLVMPLAKGGNLQNFIETARQNSTEKQRNDHLRYFRQICQGIHEGHRIGALHLQIKPQNILFSNHTAFVTDFGFIMGRDGSSPSLLNGDPRFMSPEQFGQNQLSQLTPLADIYSLGVLLYLLLHPRHVYPIDGSYQDIQMAHHRGIDLHMDDIPNPFIPCIQSCLQHNPEERLSSVAALLQEVNGIGDSLSASSHGFEVIEPKEQKENRLSIEDQIEIHWENGDIRKLKELCRHYLETNPSHPKAMQYWNEIHQAEELAKNVTLELGDDAYELNADEFVDRIQAKQYIPPNHYCYVFLHHYLQYIQFLLGKSQESLRNQDFLSASLSALELSLTVPGNKQFQQLLDLSETQLRQQEPEDYRQFIEYKSNRNVSKDSQSHEGTEYA